MDIYTAFVQGIILDESERWNKPISLQVKTMMENIRKYVTLGINKCMVWNMQVGDSGNGWEIE